MKKYEGPIIHGKMPMLAEKAYFSWKAQRQRCNNKKVYSYQHWGKKGITVEYGSRDFIGWFLEEVKKHSPEQVKNLVVGRIDHNENYKFGNIELIQRSQNSIESTSRNKTIVASKIRIYKLVDGKKEFFCDCFGTLDAQKITGVNAGNIWRYINKKTKPRKTKFIFELLTHKKREPYDLL